VFDGRKRHHARTAAGITAALTTVGLALTMSPASAAPNNQDIDSAQARVDRMSHQADTAEQRHDKAATTLSGAHKQLRELNVALHRQLRLMNTLRAQVASTVVDQYDGTAGSAAPPTPLGSTLTKDSQVMLANVTLVSKDTGGRGDAMALSSKRIARLDQRRTAVHDQITMLNPVEKSLRRQETKADANKAAAAAKLDALQAQKIAAEGGPAVAFAKAQLGKAYVFGAAGPSAYDCSGLTMAAWSQAGVSLPHSSSAQYATGRHISESELQPGDLVFYYSPISHVGMYIGNGQIVNALNPGAGVVVSGLHDMPYAGAVRPGS
jgi:cell wall-associated NlpC family hydrolase